MWRYVLLGGAVLAVALFGLSLIDSGGGALSATALMTVPDSDSTGFARAAAAWTWQFPQDHGAHPDFQTEWWYYTGNMQDTQGRRFGFQFTLFRRAITPEVFDTGSAWRADQIYMAHFTVTDVQGGVFYHDQRYSRGAAGLAGATADPRYHIWLDDWQVSAENDDATVKTLRAAMNDVAVNLTLRQVKPPALQGDDGLSAKGEEPGNASYYYSLTRLLTEGTIQIQGETFTVSGAAWMDHEFSTSALSARAVGWDWFGLHLDGDRELMLGQIRLGDGGKESAFGGLLVNADGSTTLLTASDFTITSNGTWTSPHTGAVYPSGWQIDVRVPGDSSFTLQLTPLLRDQELHGGGISYWEGAVKIEGDAQGFGYAELTGYAEAMTGRF